jgi:hypothetical protein
MSRESFSNPQGQKSVSSQLQDQLVTACEQGNVTAVLVLLKRGAKPDLANSIGKQPLGAAIWSMCPGTVNVLLAQAGDIALMTWAEYEKHNWEHYQEVFIVSKFNPQTFGEWYQLLLKMDSNPFIRALHLQKADEQWLDSDTSSWEKLKNYGKIWSESKTLVWIGVWETISRTTEEGYTRYRTQIKQAIENAIRKQCITPVLRSVGLFKEGIDLVCDYALEAVKNPTLDL